MIGMFSWRGACRAAAPNGLSVGKLSAVNQAAAMRAWGFNAQKGAISFTSSRMREIGGARGMAGHSKWANIRHRKGRSDAVKQSLYTKFAKEIRASVRQGGADHTNFHLESVLKRAHKASIPKHIIDKAIQVGSGNSKHDELHELIYEGAGPGGSLFIIKSLTDSHNRTGAFVRSVFAKHGGNSGASVADFAFDRCGCIELETTGDEAQIESALECGGDDYELVEDAHGQQLLHVYCRVEDLHKVFLRLKESDFAIHSHEITYRPKLTVAITDEAHDAALHKIMDKLDEHEDIT
eukprot:CAMPEP_0203770226 /NCGR_PEP_ID=MMETSP0099_2-20121227/2669_1 /ASSEMBLY_ACC=CAM_ASM_000209 /TAXON_ID=96639 /ORGANISM=" , Strain NY0313808BC1" /LENGTH=293 /DNA_ID=CAMNT_0050667291 /DNA_START=77 /DNA_END=955 /DNA_ORIENTATION=-